MDLKLNYNHLFYFYLVAKLKGFSTAGRYLNLSQSSLSTQMKSLESELKFELVDRTSKEFALTARGRHLYEIATNMFAHATHIHEIREPKTKKIRVGVSADVGRFFAVKIFAAVLNDLQENFCLEVVTLREWEVSEKASTLSIDFFITNTPIIVSEAKVIHKIEVPVDFVVSQELLDKFCMPFLNNENFSELLLRLPIGLMSEKSKFREETQRFLGGLGIFAEPMLECDAFIFAIQAVNSGLVSSFLPRHYSKLGLISREKIQIFTSTGGLWKHEVYFGVTTNMINSSVTMRLTKMLNNVESDFSF